MTAIPVAHACGGRPAACRLRSCPAPPSWLSPPEVTPALCPAVEWQALDVLWPEGLTAGVAGCLSNDTVRGQAGGHEPAPDPPASKALAARRSPSARTRTRRETERAGAAQFRCLAVFACLGTAMRQEEMWS